jgi:hypothetical protein
MKYIRKLMEEYEKWGLTINSQKNVIPAFMHLSRGKKSDNGRQQRSYNLQEEVRRNINIPEIF